MKSNNFGSVPSPSPAGRAPSGVWRRLNVSMLSGFGLALLTSGALQAAEAVTLVPKWNVGERHLLRVMVDQDQEISNAAMPQPMKQQTKQEQDFNITVLERRPGGGYELEIEYARMQLETRMAGQVLFKFDSADQSQDDTANPVVPLLRGIAGAKFKLLTRANGEVEKVEGVQELIDKLGADAPPLLSGMLHQFVNEDSLKQIGSMNDVLPDTPVKPGDQWPVHQKFSMGPMGGVKTDMTYTFKGWETRQGRRCAALAHTGTIASTDEPGTGPMTIGDFKGDTRGTTWFDPELGYMLESVADQDLQMKVSAMGQDTAVAMKQKVTNQHVQTTKVRP